MKIEEKAFSLSRFSLLVLLLALGGGFFPRSCDASSVHVITGDNFVEVEKGEWMLEFYAPWCPACKQFTKTWESFAEWTLDIGNGMRVAKVDVTKEAVLSGQFMVTHLPSLFHVYDGEVRAYSGTRSLIDLQSYVEEEKWRETDAIPFWRSPTSKHMQVLGLTYWISQKGKEFQTWLEDEYSLPTYSVFVIIAVGTIVFGLILGGITVFIIEMCIRLCSKQEDTPPPRLPRQQEKPKPKQTTKSPLTTDDRPVGGAPEEIEDTDKPNDGPTPTKEDENSPTKSPEAKPKKARKRKKKNKDSSS